MELTEYFGQDTNKRRILITAHAGKGKGLIRDYEQRHGAMLKNVICRTIDQMAEEMHLYIRSADGYAAAYRVIEDNEAVMLLRSVIDQQMKKLKFFGKIKINLATAEEIYNKINLIRANGWKDAEAIKDSDRLSDLDHLIRQYESRLLEEQLLDRTSLVSFVVSELDGMKSREQEIRDVWGAETAYLEEDTENYSGIQKKLLSLLGAVSVRCFDAGEPAMTQGFDALKKNNVGTEFFRGYGSFNEAAYVVNDIADQKLPLGKVQVFYSAQSQLPAIRAAFQGNGLAANYLSGCPAQENPYVSLVKSILDWAADDYSEKALERILANPVLSVEYTAPESPEEKQNAVGGLRYFSHVTNARNRKDDGFILGWGFERNREFIRHEEAYYVNAAQSEAVMAVLQMHKKLLDIFADENGVCYNDDHKAASRVVCGRLLEFIREYVRTSAEYAAGMEAVKSSLCAASYDDRALSLKEILDSVEQMLLRASITDAESPDAVSVQKLGDWTMIDRPYVYMIGLSLKEMQGVTNQSPVLTDQEMEEYLKDGFCPTIEAMTCQREKNLCRTLMAFHGEKMTFGYSSYDTTGFCENNPSTFYREALGCLSDKDLSDIDEFIYGNPRGVLKAKGEIVLSNQGGYAVNLSTSNSSMEKLLHCPKQYFYQKLLYLTEEDFVQKDYEKWLDSKQFGTFFHELAERYAKKILIRPADEDYNEKADDAYIEYLADDIKKKMLKTIPVAIPEAADRQADDICEMAKAYFDRVHKDLTSTGKGWRVLLAEQEFEDAGYDLKDYNDTVHSFVLKGFIDRIDYKVIAEKRKVLLRIVDYKTGYKESKEKEHKTGKLLQYELYKNALISAGKYKGNMLLDHVKDEVAGLEKNPEVKEFQYEFQSFLYEFPKEKHDPTPLTIGADELEGVNIARWKACMSAIHDLKRFPDPQELFDQVCGYAETCKGAEAGELNGLKETMAKKREPDKLSSEETKMCGYCDFVELCAYGKGGTLS